MQEKQFQTKRAQSARATTEAFPLHSDEAEIGVLGSLLADNAAIDAFLRVGERDDFYRDAHKALFDAMFTLGKQKTFFDIVLLKDYLKKQGAFDTAPLNDVNGMIGEVYFATTIADSAITAANIDGYAKTIHAYGVRRRGFNAFPSEKWFDLDLSIEDIQAELSGVFAREPKRLPEWCFWGYDERGQPRIEAHKYLSYLEQCEFATFQKLTETAIVQIVGFPQVMEQQERRGMTFPGVKDFVTTQLIEAGFPDVADVMLMSGKFYSLDILELLPPVPKDIAYHSIFTEVNTEITLDSTIQDEQRLIVYHNQRGDSVILSTDNYCSITADTGIGKSLLSELIASEALVRGCEQYCPFDIDIPEGRIIWFDGERGNADVVRTLQRIAKRVNIDAFPELLTQDKRHFKRLEIRAMKGIKDKVQFILEFLEAERQPISLIIIDGALDLVKNMNDEEQASGVTNLLDHLSKKLNCGIIITVHASSNQKDVDGTGMGHVGKGIGRGAASRTMIKQQDNEDSRDIKCWTVDFPGGKVRRGPKVGISAYFEWETATDMPHFIDFAPPDKLSKVDQRRNEARKVLREIFDRAQTPLLRHKDLYPIYAMARTLSDTSAKREIGMALGEWGLLEKIGSQYAMKGEV